MLTRVLSILALIAATLSVAQNPAQAADKPPCVISADCPAGAHCDLSECVQSCVKNYEQRLGNSLNVATC